MHYIKEYRCCCYTCLLGNNYSRLNKDFNYFPSLQGRGKERGLRDSRDAQDYARHGIGPRQYDRDLDSSRRSGDVSYEGDWPRNNSATREYDLDPAYRREGRPYNDQGYQYGREMTPDTSGYRYSTSVPAEPSPLYSDAYR